MDRIKQAISRIDELSLRERVIVFAAILLIMIFVWYSYLMEPLLKQETRLLSELDSKRTQLTTLNEQIEQLTRGRTLDPNDGIRKNIQQKRSRIAQLDQELKEATASLVSPESMPDILRLVLNRSKGLTLQKLKGLGGQPLVLGQDSQEQNQEKKDEGLSAAYKHGLQIQFSGNFHETLAYIKALEELDKGFFWDAITYEVKDYPGSITTITLFTLSLDQDWISIKKS